MPSDTIISVENVSKRYTLNHKAKGERYTTLRDVIARRAAAPFKAIGEKIRNRSGLNGSHSNGSTYPPSNGSVENFWALKDVSFEIKQGDVVGITGRNGAGKSVLLKILSRITEPTEGRIRIRGRVASLLEVGTGFHPELSGRENIYLNGAILGMSRAEIKAKFDEIVAFAEVEKFLDTPVKRYSSGMYVRLAFAIAAHLEPEILIVDEVLAVGDAEFQKKCLGKMQDVAGQGRTVLFVSHNMQAVTTLCARAILLNEGKVEKNGAVDAVVTAYLTLARNGASMKREQVWGEMDKSPGNDTIRIRRIAVIPEGRDSGSEIGMSTPFRVEVDYCNMVPHTSIIVNLSLYALDGSPAFQSLTTRETNWNGKAFPKGLFRSVCSIPGHLLNEGSYTVRLIFVDDRIVKLYDHPDATMISISDLEPRNIPYYNRFIGHVHPLLSWRTELLEEH